MASIKFVYPKKTIPLSVTGEECALNCAHCNGHYLRHMKFSLSNIDETKQEAKSYLVSGGCDSEGAVPLRNHVDMLRTLSKNHKVIAHTGLIKKEDVPLISPYIYAVSFNMIGEDSTIKEVYNINKTTKDFVEGYNALRKEVKTFPHITIGLHRGEVKGEYNALDMLYKFGAEAIVFNVFIPTQDTEFEDIQPPNLNAVQDVISYAKQNMDGIPIYLGCMRPGGSYREKIDTFCVKSGIDRIVIPSKSARGLAKNMGYEITEGEECCII